MRLQPALAFSLVLASVASASAAYPRSAERPQLSQRDEHGHHHAVAPLLQLNETEVTLYHEPTPPSYYTIDWEDLEQASARYPALIITHAVFMSLAFFVFLPIGEPLFPSTISTVR